MNESPLGRYASPSDDAGTTVRVQLLGVPLRVMSAAREHHDGLMREFRLLALSGALPAATAPARLVELVDLLGMRYGATTDRPDRAVDAALDRGDDTIDLSYEIRPVWPPAPSSSAA